VTAVDLPRQVSGRVLLSWMVRSHHRDRGGSNPHPALLEREDCTLVAWYRFLYAPRTGGAYDSHHRTAGIAGRTRRRCCCVAAGGARAAAGVAGDWISLSWSTRSNRKIRDRIPQRAR